MYKLKVIIHKTKIGNIELWHDESCVGFGTSLTEALAHPVYRRFLNIMKRPVDFNFRNLTPSEIDRIINTLHT